MCPHTFLPHSSCLSGSISIQIREKIFLTTLFLFCCPILGPVTRPFHLEKKARRDETRPSLSRLVTLSRETASKLIFCLDRKNTAKTTKYFQHFVQNLAPYLPNLVSYLVSSRHFWSRDKTGETISRLVS